MTLPRKPTVWFWLILAAGLLFGSIAATATAARGGSSAWAVGLQTGLLASTLVAAFWYALITHRLFVVQRDAGEIAEHPWLHVSGWPAGTMLQPDVRPYPVATANITIMNAGRTPALLQRVSVIQPDEPGAADWPVTVQGDANPRALTPGQGVVVDIAQIEIRDGDGPVYVDVAVDYETVHGGQGRLVLRFRYGRGGWKSRETRYECTLSSGLSLPRRTVAVDQI